MCGGGGVPGPGQGTTTTATMTCTRFHKAALGLKMTGKDLPLGIEQRIQRSSLGFLQKGEISGLLFLEHPTKNAVTTQHINELH